MKAPVKIIVIRIVSDISMYNFALVPAYQLLIKWQRI